MASLSPADQQDVLDFTSFLAGRRPQRKRLRLDWAGGLEEFKERYISIQLEKNSLNWWGD